MAGGRGAICCWMCRARRQTVTRESCQTGYLGAQIALASDAAGALYALWNAGGANGGPERMYFSSSTTGGASWSERANVSNAAPGVEHAFPAIVAGASGDVRIAWMDARASELGHRNRPLWNTFYRSSTNGGATWNAETRLSGPADGYDYILPRRLPLPLRRLLRPRDRQRGRDACGVGRRPRLQISWLDLVHSRAIAVAASPKLRSYGRSLSYRHCGRSFPGSDNSVPLFE